MLSRLDLSTVIGSFIAAETQIRGKRLCTLSTFQTQMFQKLISKYATGQYVFVY